MWRQSVCGFSGNYNIVITRVSVKALPFTRGSDCLLSKSLPNRCAHQPIQWKTPMPSIQKGKDIIWRQTFFGDPSQGALFGLAMGIQFGFQFLQAADSSTIHPRCQNPGPLLLGNGINGTGNGRLNRYTRRSFQDYRKHL